MKISWFFLLFLVSPCHFDMILWAKRKKPEKGSAHQVHCTTDDTSSGLDETGDLGVVAGPVGSAAMRVES